MKRALAISTLLLGAISTSVYAFNTDNRSNHAVKVWSYYGFYYEVVPAHTISRGKSSDGSVVLCVQWTDKKDPFYKNCCELSHNKTQVVEGNYKTDSNPSARCP